MDSCFTGKTDGASVFGGGTAPVSVAPRNVAFDHQKMAVITAGTDKQYSNALRDRGHRLFSYYLMHSLLNGRRDVRSLYQEVSVAVRDKSQELGGTNQQDPVLAGNSELRF